MVLLLLLDKANLPQESSSSLTLLVPMREGSVPLLQLNSPALGWLLVFKPFSWQICQGRWDFWQSCCYQKCATVSFCPFFFICASQPSRVCQTTVVHCTQEDVLHPSRAMGGRFLVSLASSLGYLAYGCCNHGHCSVRHRWGSGSWLFLYLQCHSWLEWGGEDEKDIEGHEDFKKAKDSSGPKYVFTAELWNSILGCEFPLFPKLDWIER